jgi:hypothetical protein
MSNANGTIASMKDTSTLVRAVFEPGMLLQHEDLAQLNAYTRDLSRMLFRSFFGCGVVCGLVVEPGQDNCGKWQINVGSGLALDCAGDPIYVPKDQQLPLSKECDDPIAGPLWVVLCGSMKCCGPRTSLCSPDDENPKSVCTRERDCFEVRVVKDPPKCACGWPEMGINLDTQYVQEENDCDCVNPALPCYLDHYGGNCKCKDKDCQCCGCDCILLARLDNIQDEWTADHRVRRFIRPVLMRDPQVENEQRPRTAEVEQEMKVAAEKIQVERQLQFAAEKEKKLQVQLKEVSEKNKLLTATLEKIKQREEEQKKADAERKEKAAAKAAAKKKEDA